MTTICLILHLEYNWVLHYIKKRVTAQWVGWVHFAWLVLQEGAICHVCLTGLILSILNISSILFTTNSIRNVV